MKKIAALFLLALLIIMPLSALATGTTVQIAELGMSITFPEGFIMLSRDIDEADENLALLGTTAADLEAQFIQSNVYFNAIKLDPLYEYVVTMITDADLKKVADFSDYTDEELAEFAEYMMDAAEEIEISKEAGLTYSGYEIERIGSYTYIVAPGSHTLQGQLVYANQYYTIYNGQAINVTLQSYTGEVTPEMKAEQRAIVETIVLPEKTMTAKKDGVDWGKILRSGLIGAIIGALVFFVIKGKKKKQQAEYADEQVPSLNKRLTNIAPPTYCKDCGAKIEPDQQFCGACGARTDDIQP